jgi:phage terminase small subunit
MKGRKKTPRAVKALRGTIRRDRTNAAAPEPEAALPVAPAWLPARAAELFATLTARLATQRLASVSHTEKLALLALRLYQVERYTAVLEREGATYESTGEGGTVMHRARPEEALRNEAMRHAQSLLSDFGLDPASVEKVSAAPAPVSNEWAALQARYFTPPAALKRPRGGTSARPAFDA